MDRYKRRIGKYVLVPSDGGRFEVSLGSELLWSKVETGKYPESARLFAEIDRRLKT